MSWLGNLGKWIGTIINPVGALLGGTFNDRTGQSSGYSGNDMTSAPDPSNASPNGKGFWQSLWDDLVGKTQIDMQNQYNRELAEEEYQRNLQSIGDTAAAYEAAGFNRNLMYNQSPAQYNAPNLTAYSGSQKIDRILQMTGKVLGLIPSMYQATAALESIDQARERTKQSEIKTMSMGMSLLDQGYKLGDLSLTHPFSFNFNGLQGGKRHYINWKKEPFTLSMFKPYAIKDNTGYDFGFSRYADAALKNKFDLLSSIGIKNQMNSTLNNWRGYQYSLDRRFGAAGRIVGMGTQGLGAVAKFFSPIKFGK